MKYLFIDTETTGLPRENNLSPMEIDKWPRLVSVAYILCDEREVIEKKYFIIKPKGFIIPPESTKIHGITTAEAISNGCVLSDVLESINPIIDRSTFIVGHNVIFDINIINAEFYRYNKTLPLSLKPYYCTMRLSKDICGLPNKKYPTLEELYNILKGESIENAHNAMADTEAAMECFWLLYDSGIIKSSFTKPMLKIYPTEDNITWIQENIPRRFSAMAYAFAAIAYNYKYNKQFLGFRIKMPNQKYLLFEPETTKYVEENGEVVVKEYTKDEWVHDSFNFFEKDCLNENYRNHIVESIRNLTNEYGGDTLIERFQLKKINTTYAIYEFVNESDWLDFLIYASGLRIIPFPPEPDLEIKYFNLMIDYINKKREEINDAEREKEWKREFARYGIDIDKGEIPTTAQMEQMQRDRMRTYESLRHSSTYTTPSKKPQSSSSGCMFILPLFLGISTFIIYFINLLIG